MATTNDDAVVDLGRLKTFKSKLDASMGSSSSVNAATTPLPSNDGYVQAESSTFAVAIGNGSKAKTSGCVSLGIKAIAESEESVAIGSGSNATGEQTVCVGGGCAAQGNLNTAIGNAAVAMGGGGNTAVGADAAIGVASGSVSIGERSLVSGDVDLAVALGAKSVADADKTVSMGNDELTRRIVNVTDPINPTDAATKGYVDGVSGGMHIVEAVPVGTTGTYTADKDVIKKHWPNVVLKHSGMFYFPQNQDSTWARFSTTYLKNDGGNIVGITTNDVAVNLNTGSVITSDAPVSSASIATNPTLVGSAMPSAQAEGCTAIGSNSRAVNIHGIAIGGMDAQALGNYAIAIGTSSAASSSSISIGHNATATTINCVVIGSDSKATGKLGIAIGESSTSGYTATAIGATANADDANSVAIGFASKTDRQDQVSVGDNKSGLTRYLSNVKDPVQDQDAATRYWTKNADRSDVLASSLYSGTYGGAGSFKMEANKDLNWISVRGYTSWATFNEVWQKLVNLPNSTSGWWIKTDMKVPAEMTPETNLFSPCYGLEFDSTYTMPQRTFVVSLAVGTDGYIYIGSWSINSTWSSEPFGIYLSGHRFYL